MGGTDGQPYGAPIPPGALPPVSLPEALEPGYAPDAEWDDEPLLPQTGQRWGWRSVAASWRPHPRSCGDLFPAASLLSLQVWAERAPWRMAGAWSALTGLLAAGLLTRSTLELDTRSALLVILLADALWGALWRLTGGRQALLALPPAAQNRQIPLPYLEADSPAARLLVNDGTGLWPMLTAVGGPALLGTLVVALVLGTPATLLTLLAAGASALAWSVRHNAGRTPLVLWSLMTIGLPWLLALLTAAPVLTGGQWAVHLLMVLFWVLLGWGQERSLRLADDGPGALLIGGAQMAILVLLIIGKALLFLPVLVLLWLPGWLFLAQRRSPGSLQILWLLSLFVCGAAVAQWSF